MDYIQSKFQLLCRSYLQHGQIRLPSMSELAGMLGCSQRQIRDIVLRARMKGELSCGRRRGILLSVRHNASRTHGEQQWQQLRTRVLGDMASAKLMPGAMLGSVNEISERYGYARAACRAVMHSLLNEGIVVAAGRRYRVAPVAALSSGSGVIVHLGMGMEYGISAYVFERTRRCLFMLDQISSAYNVLVLPFPLDGPRLYVDAPERFRQAIRQCCPERTLLGITVWGVGLDTETLDRLLACLALMQVPVALFDDLPREAAPMFGAKRQPLFRRFAISDSEYPGRAVAEYALAMGHRNAAWISHVPDEHWSKVRLEGLRSRMKLCAGAQLIDAVQAGDMLSGSSANADPDRGYDGLIDTSPAMLSRGLHNMYRSHLALRRDYFEERRKAEALRPIFTRLLEESPQSTVWICANDGVAMHAHDFLLQRGLRIPREVSLLGYDDSEDAFYRGISSYNFNVPGVAQALLTHILDAPRSRLLWRNRIDIEISGFVRERRSVARC